MPQPQSVLASESYHPRTSSLQPSAKPALYQQSSHVPTPSMSPTPSQAEPIMSQLHNVSQTQYFFPADPQASTSGLYGTDPGTQQDENRWPENLNSALRAEHDPGTQQDQSQSSLNPTLCTEHVPESSYQYLYNDTTSRTQEQGINDL